jgi:hypothetical protein
MTINSTAFLERIAEWPRDLDVTIDAGVASLNLRLPKSVGVRLKVAPGRHTNEATGLAKAGEFYTNAAYEISDVMTQVHLEAVIGAVNLLEIDLETES